MDKVNWIQGRVRGQVTEDRRVIVTVDSMVPKTSPRPKTIGESGADPDMVRRINDREPGPIDTLGFIGGAVAWLLPMNRLALLEPPLMAKLEQKFGQWGPIGYMTMVRNTRAGAIWNCAEPAGGMAEDRRLELEQLKEGLELALFNEKGWVRFLLPPALRQWQDDLDQEQRFWWEIIKPGFEPTSSASILWTAFGRDSRDGVPGIMKCGPVGDISLTRVAQLDVLDGYDWQVQDCESRPGNPSKGEPEWVPLHRKVVAIVHRFERAPLLLQFDSSGRIDEFALHPVLDGENRSLLISHLSESVIDALGWWPQRS